MESIIIGMIFTIFTMNLFVCIAIYAIYGLFYKHIYAPKIVEKKEEFPSSLPYIQKKIEKKKPVVVDEYRALELEREQVKKRSPLI